MRLRHPRPQNSELRHHQNRGPPSSFRQVPQGEEGEEKGAEQDRIRPLQGEEEKRAGPGGAGDGAAAGEEHRPEEAADRNGD